MTARPAAAVIPAARPGHRRQGKSGSGRPMPLASPPDRPDVVYGFGRIDASGRVADRATIAALGWRGGDRLTLTAEAGVMIARRDPGGMVTVPARPYVVIPAALRRRCGLRAGDHVPGPCRRYNLVILAEGYTESQLPNFTRCVEFVAALEATPLYGANWAAINVYRIDVA